MKFPSFIQIKNLLRFQILLELKHKKLCGDELAEIIGKNKKEKLTAGTIYPALKFLRKKKLVNHKKIGRKKIYSLTKEGDKELLLAKSLFKKMFRKFLK
jgi:DNA-binding PadR family transcriptional regulator